MTLLARNEEDVIREHILYHLSQGVDFIIATDNLSTDSTTEILHEFERLGVLHYIYQGEDTHNQSEWVTHMARMATKQFKADWVINSDADEFWWPVHGDLKSITSLIPTTYNVLQVDRFNFLPSEIKTQPFYKRMVLREISSKNCFGKPLAPKILHRGSDSVKISNGNHFAKFNQPVNQLKTNEIEIFHYPIRSWAQFESKIVTGARALNRNKSLNKGVGNTWRHLYDLHTKGMLNDYYKTLVVENDSKTINNLQNTYQVDLRLLNYLQNIL